MPLTVPWLAGVASTPLQATLPTPSEVLFTEGLWVPLVNVGGVYILPGIPRLFQAMVSAHQVGLGAGVAVPGSAGGWHIEWMWCLIEWNLAGNGKRMVSAPLMEGQRT